MYRSVSFTRVANDYFMHTSPKPVPGMRTASSPMEVDEQAAYDPVEEMAKKEKSRIKFAENAVHAIPFVLLLCALVLWFLSNPIVNVGVNKADAVAARIEGLTIEGDIDTDSVDGTQTSILPVELGDMDKPAPKLPKKALRGNL
ncbi:uncharacterized protein LOC116131709 [Pistacia vera]|uniref:Uncharacterized protein n=1 Tax=Pistacia atlantica TaxID=434234 RepID=A0ACC1BNL2_9ROSI|nr:uncharacterized protein LOC116124044 [Pistacia vera]XP_031273235.1 uncharacterized protein LOC116131709 [Pistacia vera]KAJ0100490.1 hypothetical protein Patl1_20635 [Pistacia atlantica]